MSSYRQREPANLTIFKRNCLLTALAWTILFCASLVKDIAEEKESTVTMAKQEALTTLNKDFAFRYWGTKHGGVYVPVTGQTQVNPYLEHVEERDILSPSGKQLTLVNPAWMMRQVMTGYDDLYGVKGRITSLQVLNPLNEPDEWHRTALKDFEQGVKEKLEIVEDKESSYLRVFRPLITKKGCLKCHGHQGYEVGDVRGGVSVSIPMQSFREQERLGIINMLLSHGIFWLVGLFAMFAFFIRGRTLIAEKAAAREAVLEREDRILLLLNSTAEGIYGLDTQGYCTFCNQSALRLLGYEKEEDILGKHMHSLIHHTKADGSPFPAHECRIFSILENRAGAHYENELLWRADGSSFYAEYWSHPVKKNGKITGLVVTFVDITERVRALEALHSSEKRFRDLTENSTDWIWECNENEVFTYSSPKVHHLLGLSPGEVIGKSIFDFIDDREKEAIIASFLQFKTDRKAYNGMESTYHHREGKQVYLESSGVPIIDPDGHYRGYRGINRDISERKLLEAQLRQAQKMEAIGTLSGGIAHDFNNILAAILGYAEMVQDDTPKNSPAKYQIEQIIDATTRAKDLVRQILVFSRKNIDKKVPTDLNTLVTEALNLLRATIPTTVEIRHLMSGSEIYIFADPTQIHQVIMNLCANGAQSMTGDGGVLEIDVRSVYLGVHEMEGDEKTPGHYAVITIKDEGEGIDEAILERIFDPYFTTKAVGEGSGMGLAVVSGIIKGHDGRISVDTVAGIGTTFTVHLPAMEAPVIDDIPSTTTLVGGTEKILVVDDEKNLAEIMVRRLEKLGYQVEMFTSSSEAFDRLSSEIDTFDLIITDMTMPEMTGERLAVKTKALNPEIPIILCSGYSTSLGDLQGKFSEVLMKPIDSATFAQTVRNVLDQ